MILLNLWTFQLLKPINSLFGLDLSLEAKIVRTICLGSPFLTSLVLLISLVVSDLVDEESEVQRGRVISLKSRSRRAWAKIQIRISLTPALALFL